MSDETVKLSAKTWARTVDSINKVGYSDGIVEGQAASFQSSFDIGYGQGFKFGYNLGLKEAVKYHSHNSREDNLYDVRRINCQICMQSNTIGDNIVNLYNKQHEKNNEYFSKLS